jgi:hypothetical protein
MQCADGYETLNGEGVCYEISKAKVWIAAALSAVLVLFLAALFIWVYKKRHGVKELLATVMKNEGMQGLQLGNEVLDFASDAVVYHEVATRYRFMQGLFMAYTVAFPLSCFASVVAIGLKLKALRLQLRMRRRGLEFAAQAQEQPDRRSVLQTRLDTCCKEQAHAYAAVLCAALEDLPMGILSIVLTSMLPVGERLSVVSQLSIVYSWFNLGSKMLKATALPHLWANEKDIQRKLDKLRTPAVVNAQAAGNGARDIGFVFDERAPGSLRGERVRRALQRLFPIGWAHDARARETGRQAELELVVQAAILQERQRPASNSRGSAGSPPSKE